MTERTLCPACSAPLTYSPTDQQVRCDFCGAEYRVVLEGTQTQLRLVDKPQPQADQLGRAGQEVAHEVEQEAVRDAVEDVEPRTQTDFTDDATNQATVIYQRPPVEPGEVRVAPQSTEIETPAEDNTLDPTRDTIMSGGQPDVDDLAAAYPGTVRPAEGQPVAPGFATSAAEDVTPQAPASETFPPVSSPIGSANLPPAYDAQAGRSGPFESVGPAVQPPPTQAGKRNQWITLAISFFVVFCLLCLCVAGAIIVYLVPIGGQLNF